MMKTVVTFFLVFLTTGLVIPSSTFAADADNQKTVLVTGASSGIGRATAERLAEAGYLVYAGARKKADIDALNKIKNVVAVRLDVTLQQEIDEAVAFVKSEGRGLWGIVNNAGVNVIDPLIEADESDLQFIFDVNVYGVFRVTKAFSPLVIESGGRIVNISSIAGVLSGGRDGYGMYVMSKHAVEAFTDQLALEMAPLGVFVSAVEPGNYESKIGESRCKRMLTNQAKKQYRYFAEAMNYYLNDCREALNSDEPETGSSPAPVAAAVEHALFSEKPKEHYLVVPSQFEAQITIGKLLEELAHLNHDQPFSYSREDLIRMMDSEAAIVRGEKPRGAPGEF